MRSVVFITILFLIGCGPQPEQQKTTDLPAIDTSAVVSEGQKITQDAFQTLSTNLQQALGEGGVEYALKFCNIEAIPLTDSLANYYDIALRRASHRPRNPANRVDSLEMVTIKQYLRQIEENEELKPVTYARADTISYHAPIRIPGQLCLNCHGVPGRDIKESDFEIIRSLYPEDQATGFKMGELRGIWSIDFPASYFSKNSEKD